MLTVFDLPWVGVETVQAPLAHLHINVNVRDKTVGGSPWSYVTMRQPWYEKEVVEALCQSKDTVG